MPLSEPQAAAGPSSAGTLSGFPSFGLPAGQQLYRIHRAARDPISFSSSGEGRFDLPAPDGTVYFAADEIGALIEVFRSNLIPLDEVRVRRLARITIPKAVLRVADCTASKARGYGITAAIHSTPDYALCQRWAVAFRNAGFDGIRYRLSHDPSQQEIGIALFVPDDAAKLLVVENDAEIEDNLLGIAQQRFGMFVVPTPG